jgi:microcystin-dependent protein
MSNAFIAEIRIFGFSFAPRNWAFCDGQLLSISQNTALFSLIGTFYGGNGTTNFALPNFQGRTGVQQGTGPGLSNYVVGEQSGVPNVTLSQGQLPLHNHAVNTVTPSTVTQELHAPTPAAFLAGSNPEMMFNDSTPSPATNLAPGAIAAAGGGQPHDNSQPYLVLNFCIALQGIFPSRN